MYESEDCQYIHIEETSNKNKKKAKERISWGNPTGDPSLFPEEKKKKYSRRPKKKQHLNLNENNNAYDWELEDKLNKEFFDEIEKANNHKKPPKKKAVPEIDLDEEFILPEEDEKGFHAFKGTGTSISSVNTKGLRVDKKVISKVDKSKPTCKVNIRLYNGEVINEEFNLNQTLLEVIEFVRKKSRSKNFSLVDGFPPRPLTDYYKTIEELHLEGSLLTQRIIIK